MTSLIIGDIHFTEKNEIEGRKLINKIVEISTTHKPNFIVILGDTLDKHGQVSVQAHKMALELIDKLSNISHVYLLMGNHDLIDHHQFMTDNHIFGPFKKWKNVTVVDRVLMTTIKNRDFVFVPYVPPGRFMEALEILNTEGIMWELAECIFAHQAFKGCKGFRQDTVKDDWKEEYPDIISGHDHNDHTVSISNTKKIYYPGSSSYVNAYDESDKCVWLVNWEKEGEICEKTKKINLKLKKRVIIETTIEKIKDDNSDKLLSILKGKEAKIKIEGSRNDISDFKKGELKSILESKGISLDYTIRKDREIIPKEIIKLNKDNKSGNISCTSKFRYFLNKTIDSCPESTKKEYDLLFGDLQLAEHQKKS